MFKKYLIITTIYLISPMSYSQQSTYKNTDSNRLNYINSNESNNSKSNQQADKNNGVTKKAKNEFEISAKEEFAKLNEENIEWYKKNVPDFLQKVPIDARKATPEQLSDTSKPTPLEKYQIDMIIIQREKTQDKYNQYTRKYMSPPKVVEEIIANSEEIKKQDIELIIKLRDGLINYGQYTRGKQMTIINNIKRYREILVKNGLVTSQ